MKKKIGKVLVAGLIGLQLIGCSNQNTDNKQTETTEVAEATKADYISLSGIAVGDKVTVTGTIVNWDNKDGTSTLEFNSGCKFVYAE